MSDEIKELIKNAQNGDEKSAEALVLKNNGLIKCAVRRFRGRGVADEDLYQIGAMGLVKAIKRFDNKFDVEFSTYAVPMIMGEIRRFLRDDSIIKVSRSARETAAIIRRIRREEGDCEIEKIAERMGISYEDAVFALEATTPPESIEKELYDNDSKTVTLADTIAAKETEDDIVTKIALHDAINSLEEREKELIVLRYFKELTQMQTAKILNIGQVQVSRLEKKIIENIRKKIS